MANVTLKNIKKSFGATHVIHGIDAEIKDGEFIVIVGPSGCGKSTLLRMVAGLETITSGDIFIGDERANEKEPMDRDIAMVFQNYALYPHMSVRQNMGYGLKIAKLPKSEIDAKVQDAAKLLQLEPLLERKPRQLSGGQRQRVAMGRAIVREPSVFLFDEPLSNLDAKLRVQMRLEIRELQEKLGITALYVTHDQVEAMTMADRIVVMNHGVIEQVGTPLELYRNPKNLFVAGFIGSPKMNFIEGSWAQAQGAHTVGIRPEHISITAEQSEWKGVVKMAESLGSDTFLHIQDSGVAETLTVRADGEKSFNRGQEVFLQPKKESLHLFNEKGERQ